MRAALKSNLTYIHGGIRLLLLVAVFGFQVRYFTSSFDTNALCGRIRDRFLVGVDSLAEEGRILF